MIALPAGVRILLATKPVDFRRGAHALAALAAAELGTDPFSGVVLVFRTHPAKAAGIERRGTARRGSGGVGCLGGTRCLPIPGQQLV